MLLNFAIIVEFYVLLLYGHALVIYKSCNRYLSSVRSYSRRHKNGDVSVPSHSV